MDKPRRAVKVFCNFFTLDFNQPMYQYRLDLLEQVDPSSRQDLIKKILKENKDFLRKQLGDSFLILNWCIYSYAFSETLTISSEDAKLEVVQVAKLEPNDEISRNVLGRLIKVLQERVKLKKVGRKLFDPSLAVTVDQLEIWPGYATTLVQNARLNLLNIDTVNKVITNVNVLDMMNRIRQQSSGNLEDTLNIELTGKSVMTKYNRRIYRVDSVLLNRTSNDSFTLEDGTTMTFQQYYQDKYKVNITPNQPLLRHVDKKTQKEFLLIPDLCVMTGLNDQQRADRGLMTRMDEHIKPAAGIKLKKSQMLIKTLMDQDHTRKMIEDWKLNINSNPLQVEGERLHTGQMLFGDNVRLDVETCQNLDRDSQQKMFIAKPMNKLVIFFGRMNGNEHNTFAQMFKAVCQQYAVPIAGVESVEIGDMRNFNEIKNAAQSKLSPQVSLCIWILPGRKNAGTNYENIKRHLINNLPVPSQMILAATIAAGKNLRSIISKLLIQIGAKVGSVPWAMSELPFVDKPTMIVGLDVYNKMSLKCDIMSMVATINRTFSTYWSNSQFSNPNYGIDKFILANLEKAIEKFQKDNGVAPHQIIIMRDGVSTGDRKNVQNIEVTAIRTAIGAAREKLKLAHEIAIVFVTANKSCNAKFFLNTNPNDPNALGNPVPGTYVYKDVTDNENEFFLISQLTRRGLASPTNYYILENDLSTKQNVPIAKVRDFIASLNFKLAYMYYNTVGSIKIPAPIHYAHRLSYMIGDKSTPNERIMPHPHLADTLSLYFI